MVIKQEWSGGPYLGSSPNGWCLCLHSGREKQRYEAFYWLSCLEWLTNAADHSWAAVFQRRGRRGEEKYLLCEPLNPQPRHWISPCYYTCKQWVGQRDPLHTGDQPRSILCFPLPLPLSLSSSFFSFSCSYFFSPASAFYIKSHQRRLDEHGRSVSGLSVSLRGSLTVTRTLCPLLHLFCFYFCSPAFLKTHKLTLATCCILLLLFFLSICPFFLPILKLFAFIPLWKRCQGY